MHIMKTSLLSLDVQCIFAKKKYLSNFKALISRRAESDYFNCDLLM